MTSVWQDNLASLQKHHPELFALLAHHDGQDAGEIHDTPAGVPTLRFHAPSGMEVLAYNMENPWTDAAVHLQTVEPDSRGLAIFIGLGLGYGPLTVLRERPDLGMMVILEPSLDLVVTALRHVDLRPLLASRKVFWLIGEIDLQVFESVVSRIASLEDTHILRHVPSFQWRGDEYSSLNHRAFMVVNQLNASGGTTRKAGEKFFRNRLANLSLLRSSHDLSGLRDVLAGKPAILVAAGPSLDRSLDDLKKAAGHCVLFAVDSALAPLLQAGIMPDFVTTIDFMDLNFEKLAPFTDEKWPFSLVATIKGTPLITKRLSARRLFLAFNEDLPQQWIHDALALKELAPFSFSVAHLSLGIALLMGCDPIIFVGQDLGYTTSEADHAAGTIIMQHGVPTDREIFHVPGVDGRPVATDRGLLTLQKRFEDIIAAQPGRTYCNASAAGVHIQGTEAIALAALVEQYMHSPLPVHAIVDRAVSGQAPFSVAALVREGENVLRSVKRVEGRLGEVVGLADQVKGDIVRLRRKKVPIHNFAALPVALARKLSKFDHMNKVIDGSKALGEQVLELTYPALSENDRWRKSNEKIRDQEGYLAWLLAEIERIGMVARERTRAFDLYRHLLQHLNQRLTREEQGLARLAAAPSVAEFLAMAQCYMGSGDYHLARGMIDQALGLEPDSVEGLMLSGEVWAALLAFPQANAAWQAAVCRKPELAAEVSSLRQRQADFWIGLADEHGNVGETGDQFPQLLPTWFARIAAILAHEEAVPEALQRLWQKHLLRMEEWLARGETTQVGAVLAGWEVFQGRFPEVLVIKARNAAILNDQDTALRCMEHVVRIAPGQAQWRSLLARYLLEAGCFAEGLDHLRAAVALDRKTAVLWEELGDTLVEMEDHEGAISAFAQCCLALPERLAPLRKMGDCYLATQQPEAAIASYVAVLARCPEDEISSLRLLQARAMAARLAESK